MSDRKPRQRPPDPLPLLYRIPKAARLLGVSEKVLWRMVADREIPSVRVGGTTFVPRVQLETWLQQLPSVSTGEALRNLSQRALAAGLRAEVVETTDTEETA